jgi:hypothetical protein
MPDTLILQSHREPLPHGWLRACIDSVHAWADERGFDYRWLGDELFAPLDASILEKTRAQPVIATDLARLRWLQRGLADGFRRVVWLDADFLVFDPAGFELPGEPYALGREVWVQPGKNGGFRSYAKVHNAFLMFCRGNAFLDFYADTAERLLRLNQGGMPPQFIGPKLLTALHNIARCPVMEAAGMLSPAVMCDLLAGGGGALELFREQSKLPPAGANLSGSLAEAEGFSEAEMSSLIRGLVREGQAVFEPD